MSPDILVRGGTTAWMILARIIGPGLVIGGVVLLQKPIEIPLCVYGVAFAIGVEVYALIQRIRRRWVRDTGNGFVVIDSHGMRELSDQNVVAISLSHKQHYSQGELKATTRYFRVWTDADSEPIQMTNRIPIGKEDPLGAMIGRILETSRDRCDAVLAQGGQVVGEGWALSNSHLAVGQSMTLPLDQISAIDEFEKKISIWVQGQDEAVASFPVSSRNAHMLVMLIAARIKETNDSQSIASAGGDRLGRILFQRKSSWMVVVALWLLALVPAVFGLGVLMDGPWFAAVALLALSGLLASSAMHFRKATFRCHELGVCKTGLFGEKRLKYVDVGSFSYGATRHYHNGIYTGTQLALNFKALPHAQVGSLAYNATVRTADDDLDELRDHIAQVIAARMAEELSQNGSVQWTSNLTIRQDGIQYTPAGFFGRKEPQVLSWENFHNYNIEDGTFYLFANSQPNSVMSEQCSQANFYPGFYLLLSMFSDDEEETT